MGSKCLVDLSRGFATALALGVDAFRPTQRLPLERWDRVSNCGSGFTPLKSVEGWDAPSLLPLSPCGGLLKLPGGIWSKPSGLELIPH